MRFLILPVLFFSSFSYGKVLEGQKYFNSYGHGFLSHQVLGSSCYSFRSLRQELPCNPALIDEPADNEDPDSVFAGNLFFGGDYETIYRNRDLVSNSSDEDKIKSAEDLLTQNKPVRFEGSMNIWWRGVNTAFAAEPFRLTYFSAVANSAYPQITIHAMQEQALRWQMGGRIAPELRIGVDFLGIERKFVQEEFYLFEALPEMENHLLVKKQRLLLAEPSVAYEIEKSEESWRPLVTAHVGQLGFVDNKYEEAPVSPYVDTGLSINPPLGFGEWELGLNYRWAAKLEEEKVLRIGTSYDVGFLKIMGGYDPYSWGAGIESHYRSLTTGISYKRTAVTQWNGDAINDDMTTLEFRLLL